MRRNRIRHQPSKQIILWGEKKEIIKSLDLYRGISFVNKATSKSSIGFGEEMQCMLFDDSLLVGCDGHRMHIYETGDYAKYFQQSHLYRVICKTQNTIHLGCEGKSSQYPNWKTVWPNKDKYSKSISIAIDPANISGSYANIIRMFNDNYPDFKYVSELAEGEWKAFYYGEEQALTFAAGNLSAIVMPKRKGM